MRKITLDIVSDVVCPWCFIGYKRLCKAIELLRDEMNFEIHWHPFELNPDMPAEGEPMDVHIQRKYGIGEAQSRENRARMAAIGKDLDIEFYAGNDRRIYNTFDAHRALHWAREHDQEQAFNLALFEEYFGAGRNPSDPAVLRQVAETLGLDGTELAEVLASDRYADAVRAEEREYLQAGISAVPAFIINRQYLISGGQEPQTFVEALRKIAAESG